MFYQLCGCRQGFVYLVAMSISKIHRDVCKYDWKRTIVRLCLYYCDTSRCFHLRRNVSTRLAQQLLEQQSR